MIIDDMAMTSRNSKHASPVGTWRIGAIYCHLKIPPAVETPLEVVPRSIFRTHLRSADLEFSCDVAVMRGLGRRSMGIIKTG